LTNSKKLHFSINKNNKLKKLMADFCKIRGIKKEMVCFMYYGQEVFETDTPKSIGLKEGDNIDCFDRVPTNNLKNQLIFDKRDQIKRKINKNLAQISPEQLRDQVANPKNKKPNECSKEKLVNDALLNNGFKKTEVASVKNSLDTYNTKDEPVVNNCIDNASRFVNKTLSNAADISFSEPTLLNKLASENENLKYRIKTSNTLERLFTNYCKTKNLKRGSVSFKFQGREILDTDTPNSIGLKEGHKIDVLEKNFGNIYEPRLESLISSEQPPKLDSRSSENSEENKDNSNVTQHDTVGAKYAVSKKSKHVYKKVNSKPVDDILNRIAIRIYDEFGDKISFNIRSNQKLEKLFKKYCMIKRLYRKQVYFRWFGNEIFDFDIPMYLGIENDDIIKSYEWPAQYFPRYIEEYPKKQLPKKPVELSRKGLICTKQKSPKLTKSSDKENFHDLASKQTIENEITEKPVFGIVNIPEYSYYEGDKNPSVVSSYAKAMDNNDVELNFLKDISNEVVPSEVSLKIINQEGKKKEVQSQHETENGKVNDQILQERKYWKGLLVFPLWLRLC